MFSGLSYLFRAYIYCHSLSLYIFFFLPFASPVEEGTMETETETRMSGGCWHKRKVGGKRDKDRGRERRDKQLRQIGRSLLFMHPSSKTPNPDCACVHPPPSPGSFTIHPLILLPVSIHPLAAAVAGSWQAKWSLADWNNYMWLSAWNMTAFPSIKAAEWILITHGELPALPNHLPACSHIVHRGEAGSSGAGEGEQCGITH